MNAKKIVMYVLAACAIFAAGWLGCGYYNSRSTTDNNNAGVTVQQAQTANQSARTDVRDASNQIDAAQSELGHGQANIDAAIKRADELQSRADENAAILDDCSRLAGVGREQLAEAKRILADVDAANQ